jgi:RimJ/RimL family protein N-acetyltransferase
MQKDVRQLISKIKSDKNFKILIHDYNGHVGFIKPILHFDLNSDTLIERLKSWRNENISAYLDQTLATSAGTKKWLENNVLKNDSKVLFLVYDNFDVPIGHIGLSDGLVTDSLVEMDNIVRGDKTAQKGLISLALYELISWVFISTSCNKIYLRVFSDNFKAISIYENLQFTHINKEPLKKNVNEGAIKYEFLKSNKNADIYFCYMELARNDHFENYVNIKNFNG